MLISKDEGQEGEQFPKYISLLFYFLCNDQKMNKNEWISTYLATWKDADAALFL